MTRTHTDASPFFNSLLRLMKNDMLNRFYVDPTNFAYFLEKKNPRIPLKFRDLHRFSFLKSGATRNRHFDLSSCISYRYIFKKALPKFGVRVLCIGYPVYLFFIQFFIPNKKPILLFAMYQKHLVGLIIDHPVL